MLFFLASASASVFTFEAPCVDDFTVDLGGATFIGEASGRSRYALRTPVPVNGRVFSVADVQPGQVLLLDTTPFVVGTIRLEGAQFTSFDLPTTIDFASLTSAELLANEAICSLSAIEPVVAGDPVELLATDLAADVATSWDARFAPATTPDAARIEGRLRPLLDALVAGGCRTDLTVDNAVAGTFANGVVEGVDDDGPVAGVFTRAPKTFSATLGDGTLVGGPRPSAYNRQGQIVAETDDGGFFAGRFERVRGTRGVVYGVSGTCDGPVGALSALDGWYRAPLP
jgi:hypothetical protein